MMNRQNDIEKKLSDIEINTTAETDERVLSDALAEFERAAKVNIPSTRKVFFITGLILLIIIVSVIFLFTGEKQQPIRIVPQIVETEEPVEPVEPAETEITVTTDEPRRTLQHPPVEQQPEVENIQSQLKRISQYARDGNVNALTSELDTDDIMVRFAVVKSLLEIGNEHAEAALNELAAQLDPNNPKDYLLFELLGVEDLEQPEEQTEEIITEINEPETPEIEEEKSSTRYATGWLTDVYGYVIEGEIHLGNQKTVTDANGVFSIEYPGLEDYISSFGFAVSADGNLGVVFQWLLDEDLNDMEIVCTQFASAAGNIVDENALPVEQVQFDIVPYIDDPAIYSADKINGPWQITIDPNGIFKITSIPTGYPLALILSAEGAQTEVSLGEPQPAEDIQLGEIILEQTESPVPEY